MLGLEVSGTIPAVGSGLRLGDGSPLESQLQRELRLDPPAGPSSLLNALPSASMRPEQQMPCLAGVNMHLLMCLPLHRLHEYWPVAAWASCKHRAAGAASSSAALCSISSLQTMPLSQPSSKPAGYTA